MPTHKSYQSYLIESLADPSEAAAYLDAVFEDGDIEHILLALRNVAEACSIKSADCPSEHDLNWVKALDSITVGDISELTVITKILSDLGLRLSVAAREKQSIEVA